MNSQKKKKSADLYNEKLLSLDSGYRWARELTNHKEEPEWSKVEVHHDELN